MADLNSSSTSRLFAAVRDAQDERLSLAHSNEHARARARLLQAIDQIDSGARTSKPLAAAPSHGPWRWAFGTFAAAACAMVIVLSLPDRSLEFDVDGIEVAANTSIVAEDQIRSLSFSDDTIIALAPGGHMHIDDLRANGATVVLESGEISLSVHHEDDTSWQVAAGPWSVHVTGTQFSVNWEPSTEYFRVAVTEGSVRVEGPEGEITRLRGGDPPLVRQRGKATIEPERALTDPTLDGREPVAVLDQVEGDGEAAKIAGEGETEGETETKPRAKTPSWTDLFDDADYEAAWQALEERPGGVHGVADKAKASTLLDLADLARYTKHDDEAQALLEQLRERFPATRDAAEAAFTLGRLAAKDGDPAGAATYFELYLDERPQGSHADDALGRLFNSHAAAGSTKAAAAAARRYLERFPAGAHADEAAKLLGQ